MCKKKDIPLFGPFRCPPSFSGLNFQFSEKKLSAKSWDRDLSKSAIFVVFLTLGWAGGAGLVLFGIIFGLPFWVFFGFFTLKVKYFCANEFFWKNFFSSRSRVMRSVNSWCFWGNLGGGGAGKVGSLFFWHLFQSWKKNILEIYFFLQAIDGTGKLRSRSFKIRYFRQISTTLPHGAVSGSEVDTFKWDIFFYTYTSKGRKGGGVYFGRRWRAVSRGRVVKNRRK